MLLSAAANKLAQPQSAEPDRQVLVLGEIDDGRVIGLVGCEERGAVDERAAVAQLREHEPQPLVETRPSSSSGNVPRLKPQPHGARFEHRARFERDAQLRIRHVDDLGLHRQRTSRARSAAATGA